MLFFPIRFFYRPWRSVAFCAIVLAFLLLSGSSSLASTVEETPAAQGQTQNRSLLEQPTSVLYDPQLVSPEIRRIKERGNLIVAVLDHEHSRDGHPFVIDDGKGKRTGLDIDLLEGFAESLGVILTYNNSAKTFDELIELVARGQADVAAGGVSRTIHRAMYVNFTNPHFKLNQGLLINRLKLAKQTHGHSWNEVIKGLRGQLGVLAGSSYVKFAYKYLSAMEIVPFTNVLEAEEAVTGGTITAVHMDEFDIKMLIRNRPDQALRCQTVIFKDLPDHLAIPVSRQNPQLLRLLNIYIDDHPIDLTIDQILDKYLPAIEAR